MWGEGGWLKACGALDFAGGTVVHINAGIAALAAALVIGKRRGYDNIPTPPHNLPFTVLGAGLLWFGWFGFNAGSALAANGIAVSAFVTTNTAAAAAGLRPGRFWNGCTPARRRCSGETVTGAVAGLVAITPAAGYVNPVSAIIIGLLVSVLCFIMVSVIKPKLGYDDSLDAFGVHGVGGIFGALATGLFATKMVNPAGANGLFYGNSGLFVEQVIAVGVTIVYSFVVSFIILKLVDAIVGLRVSEKEELVGLDLSQHRERAYTLVE